MSFLAALKADLESGFTSVSDVVHKLITHLETELPKILLGAGETAVKDIATGESPEAAAIDAAKTVLREGQCLATSDGLNCQLAADAAHEIGHLFQKQP